MKESTKNPTKPFWFQVHKIFTTTLCACFGLYFISLFIPFTSSYSQFPLQVVRCGHLPVIVNSADQYKIPGDPGYQVGFFTEKFVCTEQEALQEGYSRL